MRRLRSVSLAAALLFATAARGVPAPIVIFDDNGGIVEDYLSWYQRIAASDATVKIDGICLSACTLALLLPPDRLCLTERATLGFHAAAEQGSHKVLAGYTKALWRAYYPKAIREWLEAQGDKVLTLDIVYMDASTAYRLGVQRCEGPVAQRSEDE